jgi:hypothetical protein
VEDFDPLGFAIGIIGEGFKWGIIILAVITAIGAVIWVLG